MSDSFDELYAKGRTILQAKSGVDDAYYNMYHKQASSIVGTRDAALQGTLIALQVWQESQKDVAGK